MVILSHHVNNPILKEVLYLAKSKRVKFYIKQIPEYSSNNINPSYSLVEALQMLSELRERRVTGNDATLFLISLLSKMHSDDSDVIERIIAKDLRIGMGTSNINKVFKKLIEKTPYMGATSFSPDKAKKLFEKGKRAISQVKMDGRYCNAIVEDGEVELESRSGEPNIFPEGIKFLEEIKSFPTRVYNGELTIDGVSRHVSNGMIQSIIDISKKINDRTPEQTQSKKDNFLSEHNLTFEDAANRITYTVWDSITISEYHDNKSTTEYYSRLLSLRHIIEDTKSVQVRLIETRFVNSYEEAFQHFQEMLNRGEEGTVLKSLDGQWKDGKPKWQVKMKLEMDIDLVIVGFNYGTGKNVNVISSLTCETSNGFLKTKPTGINEKTMKYITENQDTLMGTIIECKCSGLSFDSEGNYSVLHPVFKNFRDDKTEANSLQEVKDIENMIKGLV